MTSNKGLLSLLQEISHRHPHFLAIQPWVSPMVMCVRQATIVLEGVQIQAPVLQVENQHSQTELCKKWKLFLLTCIMNMLLHRLFKCPVISLIQPLV